MKLRTLQIPPPLQSQDFEHLSLALFQRLFNDPFAQLNGVSGQKQNGLDIIGKINGTSEYFGVQCKVRSSRIKNRLTYEEIINEVSLADKVDPVLSRMIVATTAKRDGALQEKLRKLSAEREKDGKFPITLMAWEEIVDLLDRNLDIAKQFYPHLFLNLKVENTSSNPLNNNLASTQISFRLRTLLSLINEKNSNELLSISKIAEILQFEKISILENYFSGDDDPPISLITQICDRFFVNKNWLLHGELHPFYQEQPQIFEAYEALPIIDKSQPQEIIFVRSVSRSGECTIVLKFDEWTYQTLNCYCHVSSRVGATGSAQLLSLYDLINRLSDITSNYFCTGRTLEFDDFDLLINGEKFPGYIIERKRKATQWWYDLLDIAYKKSQSSEYKKLYGKPFLDAQEIIRRQIVKERSRQ